MATQDMYTPEPKRLTKLLSAVINFYKFREDKVYTWEELQEQSAATHQARNTRDAANRSKVRPTLSSVERLALLATGRSPQEQSYPSRVKRYLRRIGGVETAAC